MQDIRGAVVQAGLKRIRPSLMTISTTVFGLMPIFWATGRGSDVMQPMAIPSVGGMVVSCARDDFHRAVPVLRGGGVEMETGPTPRSEGSRRMTTAPAIAAQPKGEAWHSQSAEEVLAQLGSAATGFSAAVAAQRLAANGPNELKEGKRISPLHIFLSQFKSLIIWILIVAGVISGVLGEMVDAIAILAIVVLNAVIGFYQEFNAEKSIAALKKMTAPQAKVRRDGQVTLIPASGIVAGDILTLEAGDLVAADARLLETASLKCMESALTGESQAVTKQPATLEQGDIPLGDRENMVFMGTAVAAGTGQAVVVATAMNTELGRIAGLIEEAGADEGTPLQQKLDSFGRILVWSALGIVALLFGLGLLRGTNLLELFMTSISLAVAAVPEGLPAVVTVSLALGVLRMSRRRALVRKLPAVETLGSTTVICTDKTGTLTVGEMTVRALYVAGQSYEVTGEGYGPDGEVRFEDKKTEAQHAAPLLRARDRHPRLQQCPSRPGRGDMESHRRPHRRRIACRRSQSRRTPGAHREGAAEASRDPFRLRPQTQHGDSQDAGREAPRLHQRCARRAVGALHKPLHQHRGPPHDGRGSPEHRGAKHRDGAASPARARLGLSRPGQRFARRPHSGRRGARSRVRWSVGNV